MLFWASFFERPVSRQETVLRKQTYSEHEVFGSWYDDSVVFKFWKSKFLGGNKKESNGCGSPLRPLPFFYTVGLCLVFDRWLFWGMDL